MLGCSRQPLYSEQSRHRRRLKNGTGNSRHRRADTTIQGTLVLTLMPGGGIVLTMDTTRCSAQEQDDCSGHSALAGSIHCCSRPSCPVYSTKRRGSAKEGAKICASQKQMKSATQWPHSLARPGRRPSAMLRGGKAARIKEQQLFEMTYGAYREHGHDGGNDERQNRSRSDDSGSGSDRGRDAERQTGGRGQGGNGPNNRNGTDGSNGSGRDDDERDDDRRKAKAANDDDNDDDDEIDEEEEGDEGKNRNGQQFEDDAMSDGAQECSRNGGSRAEVQQAEPGPGELMAQVDPETMEVDAASEARQQQYQEQHLQHGQPYYRDSTSMPDEDTIVVKQEYDENMDLDPPRLSEAQEPRTASSASPVLMHATTSTQVPPVAAVAHQGRHAESVLPQLRQRRPHRRPPLEHHAQLLPRPPVPQSMLPIPPQPQPHSAPQSLAQSPSVRQYLSRVPPLEYLRLQEQKEKEQKEKEQEKEQKEQQQREQQQQQERRESTQTSPVSPAAQNHAPGQASSSQSPHDPKPKRRLLPQGRKTHPEVQQSAVIAVQHAADEGASPVAPSPSPRRPLPQARANGRRQLPSKRPAQKEGLQLATMSKGLAIDDPADPGTAHTLAAIDAFWDRALSDLHKKNATRRAGEQASPQVQQTQQTLQIQQQPLPNPPQQRPPPLSQHVQRYRERQPPLHRQEEMQQREQRELLEKQNKMKSAEKDEAGPSEPSAELKDPFGKKPHQPYIFDSALLERLIESQRQEDERLRKLREQREKQQAEQQAEQERQEEELRQQRLRLHQDRIHQQGLRQRMQEQEAQQRRLERESLMQQQQEEQQQLLQQQQQQLQQQQQQQQQQEYEPARRYTERQPPLFRLAQQQQEEEWQRQQQREMDGQAQDPGSPPRASPASDLPVKISRPFHLVATADGIVMEADRYNDARSRAVEVARQQQRRREETEARLAAEAEAEAEAEADAAVPEGGRKALATSSDGRDSRSPNDGRPRRRPYTMPCPCCNQILRRDRVSQTIFPDEDPPQRNTSRLVHLR